MTTPSGGLIRPDISAADAVQIAAECYGLTVHAEELGSNQDRNYLLTTVDGHRTVLRIDNPAFDDAARNGQHTALAAYHRADVPAPAVLPGVNGELTQHARGYAVRMSEFIHGETFVTHGYLSPAVIAEFGDLAAAAVKALADVTHPGLSRSHMWDMRVATQHIVLLLPAIADDELRERVSRTASEAETALARVASELPVQVIHGDLTDDNVMGRIGADRRLHPHTVLDLGDLSEGWRVAEIAVTVSSLLHHDAANPLHTLPAVRSYHRAQPLTLAESRALWPLVVLRAAVLVASGWQQLLIDGENDYARERIAVEQSIFDAATAEPLTVMTESVLAVTFPEHQSESVIQGSDSQTESQRPLSQLLPGFAGRVTIIDAGVEAETLAGGAWNTPTIEHDLVSSAFEAGAGAAVLPYGVFRLTRTEIDVQSGAATWPLGTEIFLPAGSYEVVTPLPADITEISEQRLVLSIGKGWSLVLAGLHIAEHLTVGVTLHPGESCGVVSDTASETGVAKLSVTLMRTPALSALLLENNAVSFATADFVPAWQRLTADPATLLGLRAQQVTDTSRQEVERREQIFAAAQERYYEQPMQIERGWQHHLIDTTGRAYIDMVNNVTAVGHGHVGVANAVNRQIRLLNTNSRFLYRGLAEYSERLLSLLPAGSALDTVLLVNSGSEAVDLALRLAKAVTGRETVIALREAYHGWTAASDAISTSAYDNPHALLSRPEWVHVADVPNTYRGTYRGSDANDRYQSDLLSDIAELEAAGKPVAGFICESVLGNAGGVQLPKGYLRDAYRAVRAAGGVCIADEVQVGFGRMGSSFWGFEQSQVMPDIVCIAKPMGNGFPIGGVITSRAIADALSQQGQFFSSAGGSPLSCQVGLAVLDALETEGLQENARVVGQFLVDGFLELAQRHPLIGAVHGSGLYLGVELVRDRDTREPAAQEAAAICERMRHFGVIVQTTSERSNVLKVKPPLTLTRKSAAVVLSALDTVLTTGW